MVLLVLFMLLKRGLPSLDPLLKPGSLGRLPARLGLASAGDPTSLLVEMLLFHILSLLATRRVFEIGILHPKWHGLSSYYPS